MASTSESAVRAASVLRYGEALDDQDQAERWAATSATVDVDEWATQRSSTGVPADLVEWVTQSSTEPSADLAAWIGVQSKNSISLLRLIPVELDLGVWELGGSECFLVCLLVLRVLLLLFR